MHIFGKVLGTMMVLVAAGSLPVHSQEPGRRIYNQYCATCHGLDVRGGNASTLFDNQWQFGSAADKIRSNILEGIEDHGMPGFGDVLNDDHVNDLIDYIRRMRGQVTMPSIRRQDVKSTLDYELRVIPWVPDDAGLKIPWALDFIDEHTAIVTERRGRLRLIINGVLHPDPIAGTPEVFAARQGGLLDVALDPEFHANGWIYLGYSHAIRNGAQVKAMTRIVRGRIRNHEWLDQEVLFEAPPHTYLPTRLHFGTRIVFDRRGFLYFSIGDRGRQDHAQDLGRPNGKVHRIHRDGSIPTDNPFVMHKGAMPTIFSYGHRNPQGLAVHPVTDGLWALEHGPRGGDELNLCQSGQNYGWPVITYGINYNGTVISEERQRDGMVQPIFYWNPSTAVCGLNFYRGNMFPYWNHHLLVANLKFQDVRLLTITKERVMHEEVILKDFGRVREAVSGPDGAIYVVTNEPDGILRVSLY